MTNIRHAARKLGAVGAAAGAAIAMLFVVPATAAQSNSGVVHAGTVHANFVSTTAQGNGPGPLALHGAISAFCTDNQGPNVDHVVCPTGTFVLDHSAQGGIGIPIPGDPTGCQTLGRADPQLAHGP